MPEENLPNPENQNPSAPIQSFQAAPANPTPPVKKSGHKKWMILGIAAVLLLVVGASGGYFLNTQMTKNDSTAPTPTVAASADNEQVACTMDAKECPDGSYVSRQGPKCEFAACPGESDSTSADTSDWKTYNNSQYGVSFKYPLDWVVSSPPPSYDDYLWVIYAAHPTPNGDVFAIRSYQKSISEVFESEKTNYTNSPSSIKSDEKINLFGFEGRRLAVENSSVPITYYVYYLNRNGQTIVFITGDINSPNDNLNKIFKTLSIK